MFSKKNYYLYEHSDNGKKQLLGSVRLIEQENQWNMEIHWKEEPVLFDKGNSLLIKKDGQELVLGREEVDREEKTEKKQDEEVLMQSSCEGRDEWAAVREKCHKGKERLEEWEPYYIRYEELCYLPDGVKEVMNNSFLIHGLMNYKYILILFSVKTAKKTAIGIPGILHQREKEVASMFGFTEFVGEKEPEIGGFGYYLRFL